MLVGKDVVRIVGSCPVEPEWAQKVSAHRQACQGADAAAGMRRRSLQQGPNVVSIEEGLSPARASPLSSSRRSRKPSTSDSRPTEPSRRNSNVSRKSSACRIPFAMTEIMEQAMDIALDKKDLKRKQPGDSHASPRMRQFATKNCFTGSRTCTPSRREGLSRIWI